MANIDFGNSVKVQFQTKLIEIYGEGKKTVLIKRDDYFKLIEDIKIAKVLLVKQRGNTTFLAG